MSTTSFSGPVSTYTHQADGSASGYSDAGLAVMSQSVTLNQNSTTAVTAVVYLPANAQIVDFLIDDLTVWNSASSAVLSIGTAAAGTQYAGSVDVTKAGRQTPTYTSAQLTAMADIGSNVAVYVTVTPTGATSAGSTLVTIRYIQN